MGKAVISALGVFIFLVGVQCHFIKKAKFTFFPTTVEATEQNAKPCELNSTPAVEYCLYAIGAITILLAFSSGKKK